MILRRLADSIRQQDWFTVFLELVIVVIGILVALQVDNWNQERHARAEAAVLRQQITNDLYRNREEMQARIDYYDQGLAFAEQALEGLSNDEPPSPDMAWRTVLGAYQAGQIWPFQLDSSAFREAQNAGNMAYVADATSLALLARLYQVTAYDVELISGGRPKYRDLIRERTPWPIQNHIWNADCQAQSYRGEIIVFELVPCAAPESEQDIQLAYRTLRADPEIRYVLQGRMSQLRVTSISFANSVEQIGNLIRRLEELNG